MWKTILLTYVVMLDTNAFDCIFDHGHVDRVRAISEKGIISLHTTAVQQQELQKISDFRRKTALLNLVDVLKIKIVYPPAFYGSDIKTKKGFAGTGYDASTYDGGGASRILAEIPINATSSSPLGNKADMLTLGCAIDYKMNYLITDDNGNHFKHGLELLKERNFLVELQLIKYADFCSVFSIS